MNTYIFTALDRTELIKVMTTIAIVCIIALLSPAYAKVSVQSQVELRGYSFYGKAIMDVIDQGDNLTSYESDSSGYFDVQLTQPGMYDLNIRHNSGDFEWIQYTSLNLVEGTNSLSSSALSLNYNPARIIHVPADSPTIQGALDAIQSGGWVIVASQSNPYYVNGLHWQNKHVKLIAEPGVTLTLGGGDTSHAVNLTWSGINRSDLIKGFTFQDCQINASFHDEAFGPAITLKNGASPTIEDCTFIGNHVQSEYDLVFNNPRGFGGAVYVEGGSDITQSPLFKDCVFDNNNAGNANGGGAIALFGPAELSGCEFTWNWTTSAVGFTNAAFAAGAILIASENHDGIIIIDNCTFSDNYAQNEANDIWIAKSVGIDEIHISNNTFSQNPAHHHGQPVIKIFSQAHTQSYPTEIFIQGNRFELTERGGVYFYDAAGSSPLRFTNNLIIGVDSAQYGLTIYSQNQENDIVIDNNTMQNLEDSALKLIQGTSYTLNNNLFDNCSPYDIQWGSYTHPYQLTGSLTLNNCYFNDLDNHVDTTGNAYQTLSTHELLVEASPQLGANHEPLWNETTISPLIDRGNPLMLDPDNTPSDIGAIRALDHQFEQYSMPYNNTSNIKWMSFPVLNRFTTGSTVNSNFFGPIIEPTILEWVDWKTHNSAVKRMYLDTQGLINGNEQVTSTTGYKVELKGSVVNEIMINAIGHIQSPTTVLHLYKYLSGTTTLNENWLGYFLPDSTTPFEAFSQVLQHITYIQTQYWSMSKMSDGSWKTSSANPTINYGDMVIVKVSQDCSFTWNNSQPVDPKMIKPAENFVFTEKPDYIPLYIEFSGEPGLEIPSEIGLYVNGSCKGATVVEGPNAQICVYLDPNEEITANNSELVLWYDSKAQSENRIKSKISASQLQKNQDFGNLHYSLVISDKSELEPIVPLTQLHQNYPNPFNPSTTISYELAQKEPVSLEVFNVKGQKVVTLVEAVMPAGLHQAVWNGYDQYGRQVASGIYYYKMTTNSKTLTSKMILMK